MSRNVNVKKIAEMLAFWMDFELEKKNIERVLLRHYSTGQLLFLW
jgi:hypothetical protein